MIETAHILAGMAAIALLAAGVFWMKVSKTHRLEVATGEKLETGGNFERASLLLVVAVMLSAASAFLAITGRILV